MSSLGKRLYLRALPSFISEKDIRDHLSSYGNIVEVKLLRSTPKSRSYAFVQFELEKDARDVLETFRGQPFLGQRITIELAHPLRKEMHLTRSSSVDVNVKIEEKENKLLVSSKAESPEPKSDASHPIPYRPMTFPVKVTDIPKHVCWQELKDFGRLASPFIVYCDIPKGQDVGITREGFIEYKSEQIAQDAARKLDRRELGGKVIRAFCTWGGGRDTESRRRRSRSRSPLRDRHRATRYPEPYYRPTSPALFIGSHYSPPRNAPPSTMSAPEHRLRVHSPGPSRVYSPPPRASRTYSPVLSRSNGRGPRAHSPSFMPAHSPPAFPLLPSLFGQRYIPCYSSSGHAIPPSPAHYSSRYSPPPRYQTSDPYRPEHARSGRSSDYGRRQLSRFPGEKEYDDGYPRYGN